MVSEEWPATEQGPDCPEPAGDEGLGPIELSAEERAAGPGETAGRLRLPLRRQHQRRRRRRRGGRCPRSRGGRRGQPPPRLHVLRRGPGADHQRHRGARPRPRHRRRLHALAARDHLPQGRHPRGHEPVPLPAGQHPRAGQLGPSARRRGRHRQGHRRWCGRRSASHACWNRWSRCGSMPSIASSSSAAAWPAAGRARRRGHGPGRHAHRADALPRRPLDAAGLGLSHRRAGRAAGAPPHR